MSDEIRVNRPAQQPAARPEYNNAPMIDSMPQQPSSSKMPWYILGVVVVVLIVLGVLFRDKLFGAKGGSMTATKTTSGTYQAVFLTNGQVYFGKMLDANSDYATLKDIYYLQVIQPQPLQGTPQDQAQQQQQQQQPQISLVKLGNELHGPVDEMHIAKTQILFYEDLKDDGNVVKAIQQYKANPSGTPAPAPAK
jgi:hypothetical protein